MFRFSKSKDKQKSWIIDFVLGKNNQKKGQIVKVCRHISGPEEDGSITKQVSDNAVFITAIFTQEAIDNYSFDEDMCTPPEWNQALLIVKEYSLVFLPSESLENCQFALAIKKFSLLDLNNGIESKNRIYDCMANPLVQKAAQEVWTEHNANKGNTEDSLMLGSQLSVLLEAMGPEAVDSQIGSQRPSTNKENDMKKQSSQDLWSYWERLKRRLSVTDWIIPKQQEDELASIEEWKEDYVPPPSSSRSDSGDTGSSQLQPIPGPSLPGSSGDQAAKPGKESKIPEPAKDSPSPDSPGRKKVNRRGTTLAKRDCCDVYSPERSLRGSSKEGISGKTIVAGQINDSRSPGGKKGKKKFENIDAGASSSETDNTDTEKHAKPMSPKRKLNVGEDSSEHCVGSSGVKEEGKRDTAVRSAEEPKNSDLGTKPAFEKEKDNCNESSKAPTPDIEIVEVFTLANLPTAWHTSQESIQLSCPSQTDSQEDSQFENSQDSFSKKEDVTDFSQSENSQPVPNNLDEVIVLSEDPIRDDVQSGESITVLPAIQEHQEDKEIGKDLKKSSEKDIEENGNSKDSKNKSDEKQKSSTPSRGQRKRVTSFFNKSIDASCIARASTSSRISSVGDEFESALLPPDDAPPSPPTKDADQNHKGSEADKRRVSFAPTAMSTRSCRKRSEALDATDSMVYMDAKSHLSNMESPDIDYPQSQPFIPATQDPLAEYVEEDGIVHHQDISGERLEFESGKGDSHLEMSYHHSTQSSTVALGKPDLSISPIRETKQLVDTSISDYNNSEERRSSKENNGSSVSVVPNSELIDQESHSKSVGSSSTSYGKTHESENVSGNVPAPRGKSYLNTYCEQHPSFAESGSEEQIPLSGSIYDFPDSSQETKRKSPKKFEKIPTVVRRSSRRKSQPVLNKEPEKEEVVSKCQSQNAEKKRDEKSENLAENLADSVEIEEYSTSCSDLEDRYSCNSSAKEKNVCLEQASCEQPEEKLDTLPASETKASGVKKRQAKTKQKDIGEVGPQFYERLDKLTRDEKQKETKISEAKKFVKGLKSDNSEKKESSRRRQTKRRGSEITSDDDNHRLNDNVQSQDVHTNNVNHLKQKGLTGRRQSKAKENKRMEDDYEDKNQDENTDEDNAGFIEKNSNRDNDTKKVNHRQQKDTTNKRLSKMRECENAQENLNRHGRLDTSSTSVVALEDNTEELPEAKSKDTTKITKESEVNGCEEDIEDNESGALNTQDAELVVLTALGMDTQALSELIPVTEILNSERKSKNREKPLSLKKRTVLTTEKTDDLITGKYGKKKSKSTSPYFETSNQQEETNYEFGTQKKDVKFNPDTSVVKRFVTMRRNLAKKQIAQGDEAKENTVTPLKRKLITMSEQVETESSKSRRRTGEPGPSNIRPTSPDDVIELDVHDEGMAQPKPDILKMMDQTLKRLNSKVSTRNKKKTSSVEKTRDIGTHGRTDHASHGARSTETAHEISRLSSAETLLTFLNVKPLTGTDNRVLNYRTTPSLKRKIHQVYQKPIHYPSEH